MGIVHDTIEYGVGDGAVGNKVVPACDGDLGCEYPSEQGRGILGAARGNVGPWRSMRTRSTMPFWRCYG